jgi:hypothetical protein
MKISELYNAVAKLGFMDSLEDISAFFGAANRAMLQINALRPLTAILEIYHRGCENLAVGATHDIIMHTDSEITIDCTSGSAKAYYFEVNGCGRCNVEVYNSGESRWEIIKEIGFDTKSFAPKSGFFKDEDGEFVTSPVRLRFIGDYVYQIRNAALWGVLYSGNEEDIPAFTEYVRYDLREIAEGFIELADNPFISSFTRITDDYIFESGAVLLLPRETARDVKIKYRKRPRMLVYNDHPEDDNAQEIDLDPELAELMPLLTAVYVLADEGDGKSEYYMQLYRERAAEIEIRKRSRDGASYENVTGW